MRSGPTLFRTAGVCALAAALMALSACRSGVDQSGRVTVVASVYPLAWLVDRIGGDLVSVTDLTPPGVEAHDAVLTARQRAALETSDIVMYLGPIGFQPDVEQAVVGARGHVVDLGATGGLLSGEGGVKFDPHVWLDPLQMAGFAAEVGDALQTADPSHLAEYAGREAKVIEELTGLRDSFKEALASCRYDTFVASHEAFAYLAAAFGLKQIGIQSLVPESEPSADRIVAAQDAIETGKAAPVVFYENTDEGERIAASVASDAGASTVPLGTLEARPDSGDYVSVMEGNLANLAEGLQCK